MSFSQENGYFPQTFDEIMSAIREAINGEFGTSYTQESFVGTGYYKYAYALTQKILSNETKTAEIFLKYRQYISTTNERIQRPSVSFPGLIDSFQSKGYTISVREPSEETAGIIAVCAEVDDTDPEYAEKKTEICTLLSQFTAPGMWFEGTETEAVTLSNGQSFDFSFYLPNRLPTLISVTIYKSKNSLVALPSDEEIRQEIFDNIQANYRLGWDFEPQRYYGQCAAKWAAEITLQWSIDNGVTWHSNVRGADFRDLMEIGLEDIAVVIL